MLRLNHVALTAKNREFSAEFYTKWFGMGQRVHEDDHLLILSNGSGDLLALSEGEVPQNLPRTNHFGFQVGSTDEVREMRNLMRDGGVKEAEWQETGPTRLQVFDPDGYRVEVYAF